jgi:tetratricopeptide (TPR) repeat protein
MPGETSVKTVPFSCVLGVLLVLAGIAAAQGQGSEKGKAQEAIEQAKKARSEGRHEAALTLLEEVFAAISNDAQAMYLLADSAVKSANYDKAVTYSVKAVDLDPKNPEVHVIAASAFFNRAEEAKQQPGATEAKINSYFEDALSFTKGALALRSDDAGTWALQGELEFLLSQFKDSAGSYLKAVDLQPGNVSWLYYAARGHRFAGNFGTAVEIMEKAIALQPDQGWLYREKGNILASSGAPTAPEEACLAYGAALKAKSIDDQTRLDAPRAISGLLAQTKPTEARLLIEGWAQAHPKDVYAWWWLGWYDLQAKNFEAGLKNFAKAFEISGNSQADAAVMAGDCEAQLAGITQGGDKVDLSRLEKAASWMVKAGSVKGWQWPDRNADPVHKLLFALGGPLVDAGRMQEAASLVEKHALTFAKDDYRPYNSLGFLYREIGSAAGRGTKAKELWSKSREYYIRASELVVKDPNSDNPTKAQVLNDTGLMYHYHFDDIAKGVEYYKKALGFDSEYGDALENLGICLNKLGKYEEAAGLLEKLLKLQPGRTVALRELEKAKKGMN